MNTTFKIALLFFVLALTACQKEDELPNLEAVPAPTNISALMTITPDNSGRVTIRPNGQGVTAFTVFFGDGTDDSADLAPGGQVQRTYAEGTYPVRIMAMGINGKTTEETQTLTVAFIPPQNLQVSVVTVAGNPFAIDLSASADFATFFEAYFGDVPNETPTPFMPGQTLRHTYAAVGTYELRVVARSGSTGSTEATTTVTIADPLTLPIDFESPTQGYAFVNFGGAAASVVDNPAPGEANPSAKVGQLIKQAGSEGWAGSFIDLGQPIDFSTLRKIAIKVRSPQAGIPIIMKLENIANPDINIEVTVTNTVANQWEELLFDFDAADPAGDYQRIVLFFNFGTSGDGSAYFFDDLALTDGNDPVALPLGFESATANYLFTGFGGAAMEVIDNPAPAGINTSGRVGQSIKNNGSETWAGAFIDLTNPINFGGRSKLRMKVWSPQAGASVLLKLESILNPGIEMEVAVPTTVANAWHELEFNFAGINGADAYQRVVLFFDFGNAGNAQPYYFDDIILAD